jgi:two-component system response regulator YesN
VDDEELVRNAIIKKLNWQEIGFDVIEQAEDGEQAYELALKLRPDVVLTDIRMPFMDGLELADKLAEDLPNTKVVILSGHDEFEYAQEAIKLGVLDYILKPIHSAKLTELLINIVENIKKGEIEKQKLVKLKSQLHQSLPLLKEKFFLTLLNNTFSSKEISKNLEFFDISFPGDTYIVCASEIDNINQLAIENDAEYMALTNFSILNIESELIGNMGYAMNDATKRHIMILSWKDTDETNTKVLYNLMDAIRTNIEKYLNITVTIGIGRQVGTLEDIHLSYEDAINALDCKITMGKNKIYNIKDFGYRDTDMYLPIEKIHNLISTIKLENIEAATAQINDFFEDISKRKNISLANIHILVIELIFSMQKIPSVISNEYNKENDLDFKIYESISKCETVDDFKSMVIHFASKVCSNINASRNSRNRTIIVKAKNYINENYSQEDLSLNNVAGVVSVSPGYLSILFRKETDETFIEYLTKVRLEKARELLKTTPMKAYEVAYKVGYSDPHYFSLIFKKYTGMTPTDYKNSN